MTEFLPAARNLHEFIKGHYWHNDALIGPDPGVRFNFRLWRFMKSYLPFIPWSDAHSYMQSQGYWVLSNWQMYDQFKEPETAKMAVRCSSGIQRRQRSMGYWDYPSPEWAGRIGTVEGNWAAIGLLASYERTNLDSLLRSALKWYSFLIGQIGFQKTDEGLAVNYFAKQPKGMVPNITTLSLAFLGWLASVTGDESYLIHTSDMVSFLLSAQLETGEFPYAIESSLGKGRNHLQCYQYQAFQLLDLAVYFNKTGDASVLPMIASLARFLSAGVKADGHTQYDCSGRGVRVTYHTSSIAAALATAHRLGQYDASAAEHRSQAYILKQQHSNGGFAFSRRNYGLLSDNRYYPRYLAIMLHHLLLIAAEQDA